MFCFCHAAGDRKCDHSVMITIILSWSLLLLPVWFTKIPWVGGWISFTRNWYRRQIDNEYPLDETHLDAVRGLILSRGFHPAHQQVELVRAMQLRSKRTNRSAYCLCQGLDSKLKLTEYSQQKIIDPNFSRMPKTYTHRQRINKWLQWLKHCVNDRNFNDNLSITILQNSA